MRKPAAFAWDEVDTVLLDMDGTLLDLRFDNWFWIEFLPMHFAAVNGIGEDEARRLLTPKFERIAHTLDWYCIEYWSKELNLDIAALKRAETARVGYLAGAESFLMELKRIGKRVLLITNSHPILLAIKDERVALTRHFDACYSSHPFAAPKEDAAFWEALTAREPLSLERTLFIDDSRRVLDAARKFGIGHLRMVRRPDSGKPAQATDGYIGIDGVADLI